MLGIRADTPLFVGRADERARVVSALGFGWNVLVVGERGSGKTSLVRQVWLQEEVRHLGEPVFVSFAGAGGPAEALGRVVAALAGSGSTSGPEDLGALLGSLSESAGTGPKGIVVLDDVPGRLGHELFGTLRDEMWGVGMQWLVVVDDTQASVLLQPPADAFFEAVLHLRPMSASELERLVMVRLQDAGEVLDHDVLEGIAVSAGGSPRRMLSEVRQALLTGGRRRPAREKALAELGRPAHMLYAEITGAGRPVSASDEELQDRMGWTRSRLVQVLNDLEQAGLVVAATAQTGGAGRPRKMYSVAS